MDENKKDNAQKKPSLYKLALKSIAFCGAGIFVILLANGAFDWWWSFIIGGIACLFGAGSFFSKDMTDRKAGLLLLLAGLIIMLSRIPIPILEPFSTNFLLIGAITLLIIGVWNGIKFVFGLKKRT
ncbi:MAG: hypothetical protein LBC80_05390 [Treponema sp.]|jgi:uncharacterized membrane protein YjjP (DUF1212 family)|nr:hypothetical protein [Treponema sp.]